MGESVFPSRQKMKHPPVSWRAPVALLKVSTRLLGVQYGAERTDDRL